MDRCPTEIWARIFSFACTDRGLTGCALSEVSRYVRNTSRTVRYKSVGLQYIHSIVLFLKVLEGLQPEDRQVENLFLSTPSAANLVINEPKGSATSLNESKGKALLAMSRILDLVAPTVEHLFANVTYNQHDLLALPQYLPRLSTFTLMGPPLGLSLRWSQHNTISSPSLRALRVNSNAESSIQHIMKGASSLQQIHIFGLERPFSPSLFLGLGIQLPAANNAWARDLSNLTGGTLKVKCLILEVAEPVGNGLNPNDIVTAQTRLSNQLWHQLHKLQEGHDWITVLDKPVMTSWSNTDLMHHWFEGSGEHSFDARASMPNRDLSRWKASRRMRDGGIQLPQGRRWEL